MSEISLAKNSATASPKLAVARVRALLTELNLHLAVVAVLLLVNIYLIVHLFFVWRTISDNNRTALAGQAAQMRVADTAAQPLRGIDVKVQRATSQADEFYSKRLPFAVSEVAAELGSLAKHENVRLTRSQYTYAQVLAGTPHELTQVQIDVSLSGDYRPLVHVVNGLERDKLFFLIESMTLTGQESGTVNLRLRLSTYLRPPKPDEVGKQIDLGGPLPMTAVPMPMPVQPVRPAMSQPVVSAPPRFAPQARPMASPAPAQGNNPARTPLRRIVPGQRGLGIPGQRGAQP